MLHFCLFWNLFIGITDKGALSSLSVVFYAFRDDGPTAYKKEGAITLQNMRLKCGLDEKQINERLKRTPELLEIQLFEDDLKRPEEIVEAVRDLKNRGITVYLHHPPSYQTNYLDLLSENQEVIDFYYESSRIISHICQTEGIKCVVHPHYSGSRSSQLPFSDSMKLGKAIEQILKVEPNCFVWEDTIEGLFSAKNPLLINEIVRPLQLPRVIDTSHTLISLSADQEAFKRVIEETAPYTVYFHLVDTLGLEHDSLELGKGSIDWKFVKPFTKEKDFIFEIGLDDYEDSTPMVKSVDYYNSI